MSEESNFHLFGQLNTEFKTITAMINLYCLKHHQIHTENFQRCDQCQQFRAYVKQRLDRCSYGENKPSCKQCPIHCYKPQQKIKSQIIMRFSGPKMLTKHPVMAIRHLIHDRRSIPEHNKDMISNYKKRKSLLNKV